MRPKGAAKILLFCPTVSLTAMMSTELPHQCFASPSFAAPRGGPQMRYKLSPRSFGERGRG